MKTLEQEINITNQSEDELVYILDTVRKARKTINEAAIDIWEAEQDLTNVLDSIRRGNS